MGGSISVEIGRKKKKDKHVFRKCTASQYAVKHYSSTYVDVTQYSVRSIPEIHEHIRQLAEKELQRQREEKIVIIEK